MRKIKKIEVQHDINNYMQNMRDDKDLVHRNYQRKLLDLLVKVKALLAFNNAKMKALTDEVKHLNSEKRHCSTQTSNQYQIRSSGSQKKRWRAEFGAREAQKVNLEVR